MTWPYPLHSIRTKFIGFSMTQNQLLFSKQFPRSSCYHPDWILASVSGGANPLWLTEWLTSSMNLRSGMRVLDLGCGRAASSIFLCREFQLQVWAVDLWFSVSENMQRIRDAGVEDRVFPIHANARSLPFAAEFFDAIISIDSFSYYGTDDLYLNYLARFLKPSGVIGIAGAGLIKEIHESVPRHLQEWWNQENWCLHSANWWRKHWERTGIVDVTSADIMHDGWKVWLNWLETVAPDNQLEIDTIKADAGNYLGYVRTIGHRRSNIVLEEPIVSIPVQYQKTTLLRNA